MLLLVFSMLALAEEPAGLDDRVDDAESKVNLADTADPGEAEGLWTRARELVLPILQDPGSLPLKASPGALSGALQVLSAESARGPSPSYRAGAWARLACGVSDRPAMIANWAETAFREACTIRPPFGKHDLTLKDGEQLIIDGEPATPDTPVRAGIHLAQTLDASGKLREARWIRVRVTTPTVSGLVDEGVEDLVWASVTGDYPGTLPTDRVLSEPGILEEVASPESLSAFWQISAADAAGRGADLSVSGSTLTPDEAMGTACEISTRPVDALSEAAQLSFVAACGNQKSIAPIDLGSVDIDEQIFVDGTRYEAGSSVFRGMHLVQRRAGGTLESEWISNDQGPDGPSSVGCSRRCRNTRVLSTGLLVGAGGLAIGSAVAHRRYAELDGASDYDTMSSRIDALLLRNSTGIAAGMLLIGGGVGLGISGRL